jgi:hypothetical protein
MSTLNMEMDENFNVNFYRCECGTKWLDCYDCECDTVCPNCSADVSPVGHLTVTDVERKLTGTITIPVFYK